ncbi:MAG: diaminopimelate epimerase [Jatrophihabitantaceae bacterium]
MHVLKGHGTGNDFVLVPDLDGVLDLTPELVRALCDRHTGIGADGVLRVVRSANDPDGKELADDGEFFMDYRNADGSVAEMCGNGVRVFVRYLQRVSLVRQDAAVATRGGIKRVRSSDDGSLVVEMGQPRILTDRPVVTAAAAPVCTGTAVELPNPHVVVELAEREQLAGLDLSAPPEVEPHRPAGVNVEFVVRAGPRHLLMRVHERGVGETRSCGTGICAAVVAAAAAGGCPADGTRWRVDAPGGTCTVVWDADGVQLSGPAVIVAEVDVDDEWLATASVTKDLGQPCHDGSDD